MSKKPTVHELGADITTILDSIGNLNSLPSDIKRSTLVDVILVLKALIDGNVTGNGEVLSALSQLENDVGFITSADGGNSDKVDDKEASGTLATTEQINLVTAINEVLAKANQAFQSASDGKTSVASVIGSPTVATETFTQITNDIQTQKNNLATSLTAKGQNSSGTESLKVLVDKVPNITTGTDTSDATAVATDIRTGKSAYVNGTKVNGTLQVRLSSELVVTPTDSDQTFIAGIYDGGIRVKGVTSSGKKYAEGTITTQINANTNYTVSGLDFIPSVIEFCCVDNVMLKINYSTSFKIKNVSTDAYDWVSIIKNTASSDPQLTVPTQPTGTSFTLRNANNSMTAVTKVNWKAYE